MNENVPAAPVSTLPVRQAWLAPRVDDLPRLTELTLVTGEAIEGECVIGGGGSTCF